MEKIVVQGGDNRLVGSVTIEGAKNAVLPLLAATILASKGKTVLQNVPILSDVFTMNQVVRGLNAKVDFDEEAHVVEVDATGDITEEAPYFLLLMNRTQAHAYADSLAVQNSCRF